MVYCQECGTKIEENGTFCHNCGNRIKEENEKLLRRGINRIKLYAIFGGIIAWVVLIILFKIAYPIADGFTVFLIFIVTQLISSIVAGYIGNTSYKNGIVNGGILCIMPTIIFTFIMGLYGLILGFIIFLCFGIVGGVFGCFIKNKLI